MTEYLPAWIKPVDPKIISLKGLGKVNVISLKNTLPFEDDVTSRNPRNQKKTKPS
jgi:hypothetical protein